MTCPSCSAPVGRFAYLGASGLSGIVCEACEAKLAATYESRVRLNGGALLFGIFTGGLAGSLGAGTGLALGVAAVAVTGWFLLRTQALLVLVPAEPSVPSIK